MKSGKIHDINIEVPNWEESIYLTFDIDWASDFVLSDTINLLETYDVKATFFATHETPILETIRKNPNFEIGIHPNFDDLLLTSEHRLDNATDRLREILKIVPEAQSMRSHSTTNSSRILEIASDFGIKFDCNYLIPYQSNIVVTPWRLWNKLVRAPYIYEDDVSMLYGLPEQSMKMVTERQGLRVFNFHPIHVYLNSKTLGNYDTSRSVQRDEKKLRLFKEEGRGTREKLTELLTFIENDPTKAIGFE
jgi:hypothetical protein